MRTQHTDGWTRRRFLGGLTLAGTAGLLGLHPRPSAAEPPPETTRLRVWEGPVTCAAPQWVAQELLYSEGFTDVQYVTWGRQTQTWVPEALLTGEADISLSFIPSDLIHIDAGDPVVILAGSHIGCVEVLGSDRVRSTRDLKGKTVGLDQLRGDAQIFISMFAAYVGLNPHKDINWVLHPFVDHARLLTEGSIDAFMVGPPWQQEMREKKIGHVLVNTTTDKPWSQYFCCLVASTKAFVRQHAVATKRALRALLKAADVCALEPERTARRIVDRLPYWSSFYSGVAPRYDSVLQGLKEIPYGQWRQYDPEDAIRFYALWMREVGMLKSSPQQIIARGTDWRFLNELKKELKG
jgi:NitT/TauT family transport system substrate-binding protein